MNSSPISGQASLSRRRLLSLFGVVVPSALGTLAVACAAPSSPTAAPAPAKPTAPPAKPTAPPAKPAAPATPAAAPAPTPAAKAAPATKPVQPVKWRVGIPSATLDINAFQTWPVKKGWYNEFGLDVDLQRIPDPTAVKALVAGELEVFDSGLGPVLEAVEKGAELKAVASFHPIVPFVLLVRKEINSLEDLYGKTVGIAQKGSVTESYVLALLFKRGLDPQRVNWASITTGGTTALVPALIEGKIDASTAVVGQLAQIAGNPNVKVLSNIWEELPQLMRLTVVVSDKTLKEKEDLVVNFVAGYAKGIRYSLDRKDETVALMTEITGSQRKPMEDSWDWFVKNKALDPNGGLRADQIDYYQDLYVKLGLLKDKMPVSRIADLSIPQKVLAKVGTYQPGKTG